MPSPNAAPRGEAPAVSTATRSPARPSLLDPLAPWPLGLDGPLWPVPVAVFVAVLVAFLPFEHAISELATGAPAGVVAIFGLITQAGESEWILIPAAVVVLVAIPAALMTRGRPSGPYMLRLLSISSFVFAGVAVPGIAVAVLKRVIGRPRPVAFDIAGTLGFHPLALDYRFESFPSGHSTTAAALAMVVIFLVPRAWPVALLYALAVMTSRLIVGAHYPDDVLAGFVLGSLSVYAIRYVMATRSWLFVFAPDGRIRLAQMPVR